MAGIYDRIGVNMPVHMLSAAIVLYSEGIYSKAQILSQLNTLLSPVLTAAEETDLNDIADAIDAEGAVIDKIRYLLRFQALAEARERGVSQITENVFRTQLGI